MKHPTEWRYTDDAFREVKGAIGTEEWARYADDNLVFQPCEDEDGAYESMGWFQMVYMNEDFNLECRVYWPNRSAEVVNWITDDVVASLPRFDSPRQLVEWCMMVREVFDG